MVDGRPAAHGLKGLCLAAALQRCSDGGRPAGLLHADRRQAEQALLWRVERPAAFTRAVPGDAGRLEMRDRKPCGDQQVFHATDINLKPP